MEIDIQSTSSTSYLKKHSLLNLIVSMKILIITNEDPHYMLNPFISTLIDGINEQFNDVEWGFGMDKFWGSECFNYDIIHVHWPFYFAIYNGKKVVMDNLISRLKLLKSNGIKIVSTCHNLKPHYDDNAYQIKLYEIVYQNSDMIFHLGNYSLNLFKTKYSEAKNILLPHHIYDTIYKFRPSREECFRKLSLDKNYKYILCFGAFRAKEEKELIIRLKEYLKKNNIKILAPSFCLLTWRRNPFLLSKNILNYIWHKIRFGSYILFERKIINDNKLLYYFGAADITLIQRKKILNSGNLPLGFLMKTVVIGPNVGNVGSILTQTLNPVFNPNDEQTLINAINKAQDLVKINKGEDNYLYAQKNWNTRLISFTLYNYYKQLILD